MDNMEMNRFDQAAANWDAVPQRVELAKAVGQAIVHGIQPDSSMDVLDYGCGTGLVGLFLLPYVRSVTGADSSPGMLQVLEEKIRAGDLRQMHTRRLDLQHDPLPKTRYHLIVANMVLHHVEHIEPLLTAFYQMLLPGGAMAIADLDTEPGVFHNPNAAEGVYHHGFERAAVMEQMRRIGLARMHHSTVHVVRKPVAEGDIREFPVFLVTGRH